MTKSEGCPACSGHGQVEVSCSKCNGWGTVDCCWCMGQGRIDKKPCIHCDGDGYVECYRCDGKGSVDENCSKCDGAGTYEAYQAYRQWLRQLDLLKARYGTKHPKSIANWWIEKA